MSTFLPSPQFLDNARVDSLLGFNESMKIESVFHPMMMLNLKGIVFIVC